MLPAFDIAHVDRRFMAELSRLIDAGRFSSYRELASACQIPSSNRISEISKPNGRYHCSIELLYKVAALYPEFDLLWVVQGFAATGRPEPTEQVFRAGQAGRPARLA